MSNKTIITPDEYNKYKKFVLENSPEDWIYVVSRESEISYLETTLNVLNVFSAYLKTFDSTFYIEKSLTTDLLVKEIHKHFAELGSYVRIDDILSFIYNHHGIHILNNNYLIKEELKGLDDIPSWLKDDGNYYTINFLLLCDEFIFFQNHILQMEREYLPNYIKGAYKDAQTPDDDYDHEFAAIKREQRISDISNTLDEEEDSVERERLIGELKRLRNDD